MGIIAHSLWTARGLQFHSLRWLVSFAFIGLWACGSAMTESQTAFEAPHNERPLTGYEGFAQVTAEPFLFVRRQAHADAEKLSIDGEVYRLPFGAGVAVHELVLDGESGHEFANIGFGWVDARYLRQEANCTENFHGPFAYGVSDPFAQALLSVIAQAEGTGNCYDLLFGYERFDDFNKHPNQCQTYHTSCTTAAGRYQFLHGSWADLERKGVVLGFTPEEQDQGALYRISERWWGDFSQPLNSLEFSKLLEELSWEWASIPPSRYGQPVRDARQLWFWYQAWTQADSS